MKDSICYSSHDERERAYMKKRLFLAIPLSDQQKIKLDNTLPKNNPALRYIVKENYHITVLFLGYIDEKYLSDIKNRAQALVEHTKEFTLVSTSIKVFPPTEPRMVWLRYKRSTEFIKFVERAKKLYASLRVEEDTHSDKAIPHTTLGYILKDLGEGFAKPKISTQKVNVNRLILYESRPKTDRSEYHALAVFSLKSAS